MKMKNFPESINPYLLVAMGGAFGAAARGIMGQYLAGDFPYATLGVNVLGSFFLGLLMFESSYRGGFAKSHRLFLGVGFLGSFTTFSAFSQETINLISSNPIMAGLNIFLNIALCILGVFFSRIVILSIYGGSRWSR